MTHHAEDYLNFTKIMQFFKDLHKIHTYKRTPLINEYLKRRQNIDSRKLSFQRSLKA